MRIIRASNLSGRELGKHALAYYAGDMEKPLSVRIRQIRQALGETQGEFARRFGVKQASVSRWESGAMPEPPALTLLSEMSGQSVMEFINGGEQGEPMPQPARPIPILGDVPAGNWREAMNTSRVSMPSPDPSVPAEAYALKVVGDSMNRIAGEGATIIIDPTERDLYERWLYVVRNGDGEVTFKQYLERPARLVPCSTNPEHKEIPIADRDYEIVGRVIWIAMRPDQAALA